jgi:hypothetical protein
MKMSFVGGALLTVAGVVFLFLGNGRVGTPLAMLGIALSLLPELVVRLKDSDT